MSRARIKEAVERLRGLPPGGQETSLDHASRSAGAWPARFLAKTGTHYRVVPSGDVLCFSSEDGLTKLQTAEAAYWMQPALNDLEARLDPTRFFRISRAAIVSLDAVRDVHPMPGGNGEVTLKNGSKLEVSRRRLGALMEKLSAT